MKFCFRGAQNMGWAVRPGLVVILSPKKLPNLYKYDTTEKYMPVKLTMTISNPELYDALEVTNPDIVISVTTKNQAMRSLGQLLEIDHNITETDKHVITKIYDTEETANEWLNFIDQELAKYSIPIIFESRMIEPL